VGIGEICLLAQVAQYAIRLLVGQSGVDHVFKALKPRVYGLFVPNVLARIFVADLNAVVCLEMASVFRAGSDHLAVNHAFVRHDVRHDVVITPFGVLLTLYKLAVNVNVSAFHCSNEGVGMVLPIWAMTSLV
jgi:hypothetical protein